MYIIASKIASKMASMNHQAFCNFLDETIIHKKRQLPLTPIEKVMNALSALGSFDSNDELDKQQLSLIPKQNNVKPNPKKKNRKLPLTPIEKVMNALNALDDFNSFDLITESEQRPPMPLPRGFLSNNDYEIPYTGPLLVADDNGNYSTVRFDGKSLEYV